MSIQAPNIIIDCISHTRYMLHGVAGNNWNWAGPEENPQISIAASGCAEKTNHGLDVFSIHVFYHQLLSISSNQSYQCHNHYIFIVLNNIALFITDMRNGEKIVGESLKSYRGCQKNKTQLRETFQTKKGDAPPP